MKTATILFYVSPSIETHIKNAKTIDLMEGGKEHAQDVPNSEINPCYNRVEDSVDIDGDGEEGNAVQTDSEKNPVKDRVDICVDGEEGKADSSSDENYKNDDEEEEGESGEVDSSSGEESSSSTVVRPHRCRHHNPYQLSSTDSSDSSSDSSDSSSDSSDSS